MSLKSSMSKRIANAIANRKGLLGHLLNDERVLQFIADRAEVLLRILRASDRLPELLAKSENRKALGSDKAILDWFEPSERLDGVGDDLIATYLKQKIDSGIFSFDELLTRFESRWLLDHLGAERMLEHLGAERMLEHLDLEQLVERLGARSLLSHIGPGFLLEQVGPEHLMEGVGAEALMKQVGAERLLNFIGHGPLLRFIEADELAEYLGPDRIARHLGTVRLLQSLGPRLLRMVEPDQLAEFLGPDLLLKHIGKKRLLDHIGPGHLLKQIEPDDLAEFLGPERLLKHLEPTRILDHLGLENVLDHFGSKSVFQHIEPEDVLKNSDVRDIVKAIGVEKLLQHIDLRDPLVLRSVIENDEAFSRLMDDERAIRKVFLNETLKRRFRFINAQGIAAALPYRLPGAIVSYPRSGSNFVQSVLRHSSGLSNLSIYGPNPDGKDITLSLKSHAPSPEYLRDEFGRIVEDPVWPARIVLVQRDPRDVMISFYEYTQYMRQTTIAQKDFLKNTCFFYASSIDPESKRQVDNAPMSVLQAYKKHVRQWFAERPDEVDCLIVKYEDLLTAPEEAFQRVFDYLNLDCPLAKEFLSLEVSLYDDTREHRAGVATWKRHADKYRVLLNAVDRTLGDEMAILGY